MARPRVFGNFDSAKMCSMLLAGSMLLFAGSLPAQETQKLALVVGVSNYENLKGLNFAAKDARDVGEKLRSHGFDVTTVTEAEASYENLQQEIARFISQTEQLESDSVVLLMFSGHGQQLKVREPQANKIVETPFFCPRDAKLASAEQGLVSSASSQQLTTELRLINLNQVLADLSETSNSTSNLLIVDACRENPAKGKAPGLSGSAGMKIPPDVRMLFSSRSGQKSWESADPAVQQGVFTHYLLKGLSGAARTRRNQVSWSRLVEYVQSEVEFEGWKLAGDQARKQNPQSISNAFETTILAEHLHVLPRYDDALEIPDLKWYTPIGGNQRHHRLAYADGTAYVASNNIRNAKTLPEVYRPAGDKYPADAGTLTAIDTSSGTLRWQYVSPKLEGGRTADWPYLGIVSKPCIEEQRLWVINNRNEIVCLDTRGFQDGENDGPYSAEKEQTGIDADIVWKVDMTGEFGALPCRKAYGNPVVWKDLVFVPTSNSVGELELYNEPEDRSVADAPSLLALDKNTGKLVWQMKPKFKIFHGAYSSPSVGTIGGRALVFFPAADGWLYALDARTGDFVWWFDLNPKASRDHRSRGNFYVTGEKTPGDPLRMYGSHAPLVVGENVIVAMGFGEDGFEGYPGRMWCIDARGSGDVSSELGKAGRPGNSNPKSAAKWMLNGSKIYASLHAPVVLDHHLFLADAGGMVSQVEVATGKLVHQLDTFSNNNPAPIVKGQRAFVFAAEYGEAWTLPRQPSSEVEMADADLAFDCEFTQVLAVEGGILATIGSGDSSNLIFLKRDRE